MWASAGSCPAFWRLCCCAALEVHARRPSHGGGLLMRMQCLQVGHLPAHPDGHPCTLTVCCRPLAATAADAVAKMQDASRWLCNSLAPSRLPVAATRAVQPERGRGVKAAAATGCKCGHGRGCSRSQGAGKGAALPLHRHGHGHKRRAPGLYAAPGSCQGWGQARSFSKVGACSARTH